MGELRPATVEEMAALERSLTSARRVFSRRRRSGFFGRVFAGRPLIITLATACLMIVGAGAFALARTGPNATIVAPYGADAPFGVGYVDGFGEHTPDPSRKPTISRSMPGAPGVLPPAATESTSALLSPLPSSSLLSSPSSSLPPSIALSPSPSRPVVTPPAPGGGTGFSAIYWTTTWRSNYDVYVWVYNGGTTEGTWEVRIRLPSGTTINSTMAAQRSYADGVWTFKPTRGQALPGGRVYLFAFSGNKPSGGFGLNSCTVNGSNCIPFS